MKVEKELCCGCEACRQICQQGCIEMTYDEEGFLYPEVNEDACSGCGLCHKICPTSAICQMQ